MQAPGLWLDPTSSPVLLLFSPTALFTFISLWFYLPSAQAPVECLFQGNRLQQVGLNSFSTGPGVWFISIYIHKKNPKQTYRCWLLMGRYPVISFLLSTCKMNR